MTIRELVEYVEERTFSDADASNMFLNIPGPTFDGLTFTNLLAHLQAWLVDNGHEEDAEELEEALAAFQEASEHYHSAVADVLERHRFQFA